jgi:predicted ester cyclase
MSGKNDGPVLGHAPTGKPYSITATDIYRFEDGKVVERWGNADLVTLFRQLGFQLEMVSDESK